MHIVLSTLENKQGEREREIKLKKNIILGDQYRTGLCQSCLRVIQMEDHVDSFRNINILEANISQSNGPAKKVFQVCLKTLSRKPNMLQVLQTLIQFLLKTNKRNVGSGAKGQRRTQKQRKQKPTKTNREQETRKRKNQCSPLF